MAEQPITGILEAYTEQGLEYPLWTVYNEKICDIHGKRILAGQYELKQGDLLTVFSDASRKDIVWTGTINLDRESAKKLREEKRWNIHNVQRDISPENWVDMFLRQLPCLVIMAP